ncbi:MAG TPA: hypothetical protein DD738_15920 [Ruminiclostridium sp.]|nr:hypothetical protein [Ruminiclostridium sp.]
MEVLENNLDKYKSYIQKRRVGEDQQADYGVSGTSAFKTDKPEEGFSESYSSSYDFFSDFGRSKINVDQQESVSDNTSDFLDDQELYRRESPFTSPRRTDPGLYQRLYGQKRRNASSLYSRYSGGYSTPGHGTEIENNRTAVLAIKIIKQTLACFALLGIIVLLQNRSDTANTLAFIRRHVVETHIEPKSILTGLENIVQECSRFLGGSP